MEKNDPIRIIIFENNISYSNSLCLFFEEMQGIDVMGVFPNGTYAEKAVLLHQPDLVLMDLDMHPVNGIEATKLIKSLPKKTPVLILTVFEDEKKLFEAIQSGADGYLLKTSSPHTIAQSIRDTLLGGSPMTPSIARKILEYFAASVRSSYAPADEPNPMKETTSHKESSPTRSSQTESSFTESAQEFEGKKSVPRTDQTAKMRFQNLTQREIEVLSALVKGKSYKIMAADQQVSIDTIRFHIKNIYAKLHVNSATEAVSLALRNQIIP
jgi:DNA-binding NarL/FixJ family response regulator